MFLPPFCPNPECAAHGSTGEAFPQRFCIQAGTYMTKVVGRVQRFSCIRCGKGFSERTFSIDYYTKKTLDYREILRATTASESVSSISRKLSCSGESIQNRQDRLGRNCLAVHERLMEGHRLVEDLCADGFESFDRSQFWPNAINLLVGVDSQFLYGATHATLRRKGRMTPSQKARRDAYDLIFKPSPGALSRSFKSLMDRIEPMWDRSRMPRLVLRTDEHPAYPRAIQSSRGLGAAGKDKSFVHECHSSRLARTRHNPLFPVNYYDRELRKDIAAYRRESTCHGRNVANGLLRFAHHQLWHNYLKPWRITRTAEKPEVHAVFAGIGKGDIEAQMEGLYRDRRFLSHLKLNPETKKIWLKEHPTPLKEGKDYVPAFAKADRLQGSRN